MNNANDSKVVVAPEGNLDDGDRQPEVSDPTIGANPTDDDDFPTWDGGGYRGKTEVPVKGRGRPISIRQGTGIKSNPPKQGTSTNATLPKQGTNATGNLPKKGSEDDSQTAKVDDQPAGGG